MFCAGLEEFAFSRIIAFLELSGSVFFGLQSIKSFDGAGVFEKQSTMTTLGNMIGVVVLGESILNKRFGVDSFVIMEVVERIGMIN